MSKEKQCQTRIYGKNRNKINVNVSRTCKSIPTFYLHVYLGLRCLHRPKGIVLLPVSETGLGEQTTALRGLQPQSCPRGACAHPSRDGPSRGLLRGFRPATRPTALAVARQRSEHSPRSRPRLPRRFHLPAPRIPSSHWLAAYQGWAGGCATRSELTSGQGARGLIRPSSAAGARSSEMAGKFPGKVYQGEGAGRFGEERRGGGDSARLELSGAGLGSRRLAAA